MRLPNKQWACSSNPGQPDFSRFHTLLNANTIQEQYLFLLFFFFLKNQILLLKKYLEFYIFLL